MGQPLAGDPARVVGGREGGQHLLVEEVRERPMTDVVHETGHPQRLDDEALRGDGFAGADQLTAEARVERTGPQAGLVHDAKAVGEPRVLGRREDPAGALELADPPEPLQPGRVEDVLLGDVLVGQPDRGRLVAGQALGELDVPVDRVADEVDRRELVTASCGRSGVPSRSSGVRGRDIGPQRRRLQHLDVVAPRQDPEADLDDPATVARQMSDPSGPGSSDWVGCQRVSMTRAATSGVKRSTTVVGSWSAMMSQARRSSAVVPAGSGGSNVRGVRDASAMRSILNVRMAPRSSSKPIR